VGANKVEGVREFRISLTAKDFDACLAFYRDALGLKQEQDWTTEQGRCVLLAIEKATIEIIDENQARLIDSVEVGKRVSGQIRFAFHVSDLASAMASAAAKGAVVAHAPVETPWKDVNARLVGPDQMQMTFYQSPPET
jgi:catechol 2,3-dioxygenase-like lactoylglutathione lyase family enzyme